MPAQTIQEAVNRAKPKIEKLLNEHKHVLGPGREFVVRVFTRAVRTASVEVSQKSRAWLTKADWKRIFSRKWTTKFERVLNMLEKAGRQGSVPLDDINKDHPDHGPEHFYPGERERINALFRKHRLPFFIEKTTYGSQKDARFRIVRR
jgi:hypothetical protein